MRINIGKTGYLLAETTLRKRKWANVKDAKEIYSISNNTDNIGERFSYENLNPVVSLAYSRPDWQHDYPYFVFQTADLFNRLIAKRAGDYFRRNSDSKKRVRIKEISAGGGTRWEYAQQHFNSPVEVLISDFVRRDLDLRDTENIRFLSGQDDLRFMKQLPDNEKFNIIFGTYCIDSVWFKQDVVFANVGDEGTKAVQIRLAVEDPSMRQALKSGSANMLIGTEFSDIRLDYQIEEAESHPLWKYVEPFAHKISKKGVFIPGGMVEFVKQCFENQLTPDGTLIIGETGMDTYTYNITPIIKPFGGFWYACAYYPVIKDMLADIGIRATVLPYQEALELNFGEEVVRKESSENDELLSTKQHYVIIAQRM